MYYLFSDNKILRSLWRGVATTVIFAIVLASSPAVVFAEEETAPPEDTPQEQAQDPEPQPAQDGEDLGSQGSTEETQQAESAGGDEENNGDSTVETGDAAAAADVQNEVNTNVTDTTSGQDEEEPQENTGNGDNEGEGDPENTETDESGNDPLTTDATEEDTVDDESSGTDTESIDNTATLTTAPATEETAVENENDAGVENNVYSEAETGENEASGGSSATVESGNAFSFANVVNVVNTNIFNSQGLLLILSKILGLSSLDLRDGFNIFAGGSSSSSGLPCSLSNCENDNVSLSIENKNTATIVNNVIVRSSTGGNTASTKDGTAQVYTGDAYAAANVLNVANTNIVNSNYLLVSFNNVGDLAGDIILPGKEFFESIFAQRSESGGAASPTSSSVDISNTNDATITNTVTTVADTGGNTASGTDTAAIQTGGAASGAEVYNQANTNITGSTPFLMLFRIYGNWSGNIFGIPDELGYQGGGGWLQLFANGNSQYSQADNQNDAAAQSSAAGALSVNNENTALIENNIQVYALTGDNLASGGSGAFVQTGNAYAAASVSNIANTNILSRNWALLIFNIFGDWSGNLAFGQPNLWIGGTAGSSHLQIGPGSEIEYTFTVSNTGDADATDVALKHTFDRNLIQFPGDEMHEWGALWNLGTIAAGETREFSYTGTISTDIPYGDTLIETTETLTSYENDADAEDNKDIITLLASHTPPANSGGMLIKYTPDSDLELIKTSNATTTIETPGSVDYTIVIKNNGGMAYHSMLVDTLTTETGDIINQEYWNLDQIYPDEEITVTYTVMLSEDAPSGTYINSARIEAIDRNPSIDPFYGYFADSPIATSSIEVVNPNPEPKQEIAAEAVEESIQEEPIECSEYITTFIYFGSENNNPNDVERLQSFLKDHEGFTDVQTTGVYDEMTFDAVKTFQSRYTDDVLGIWDTQESTGYVYYTTQKKINELYCENQKTFELSGEQWAEIESYKRIVEERRKAGVPLPDPRQVGLEESSTEIAVREEEIYPIDSGAGSQAASVAESIDSGVGMRLKHTIMNIIQGTTALVHSIF